MRECGVGCVLAADRQAQESLSLIFSPPRKHTAPLLLYSIPKTRVSWSAASLPPPPPPTPLFPFVPQLMSPRLISGLHLLSRFSLPLTLTAPFSLVPEGYSSRRDHSRSTDIDQKKRKATLCGLSFHSTLTHKMKKKKKSYNHTALQQPSRIVSCSFVVSPSSFPLPLSPDPFLPHSRDPWSSLCPSASAWQTKERFGVHPAPPPIPIPAAIQRVLCFACYHPLPSPALTTQILIHYPLPSPPPPPHIPFIFVAFVALIVCVVPVCLFACFACFQ